MPDTPPHAADLAPDMAPDLPPSDLPMSGIRVLDCATFIAAPYTAAILGEFGAEVIKVEQPGEGDPFRKFGTPAARDTLAWLSEARNKKSVTLNLRDPKGADLFRQLIAQSDVLCENFRPGTLEKWGLGWEELKRINPRLVMLRVSGYGQDGPYRDRPGFARIAHAFGGLTYLAGLPGELPVTPGSTSLADYMSGLYGAIGVLLALRQRDKAGNGQGQYIDVALYESVFRALDELAPAFFKIGKLREPEGTGTTNACPHGHFRCGDGKFVAVACTSDKMFERLAQVMGRPELAAEDMFRTTRQRLARHKEVDGIVAAWMHSMSRDAVMAACIKGEVPCGPINSIADIAEDPHFQARGNLLHMMDALVGEVVIPSVLPRLSDTPGRVTNLGPSLGADNDAIYGDLLGLSAEDRAALKDAKVI
jgi:crotonobetainyl-CoA:carnitine CoA-transferase CaiB-like acyl-CoA transferase